MCSRMPVFELQKRLSTSDAHRNPFTCIEIEQSLLIGEVELRDSSDADTDCGTDTVTNSDSADDMEHS